MQNAAALRRIEILRRNARPKSNQLTAFEKMLWIPLEADSEGVGAARRPQLTPDLTAGVKSGRTIGFVCQLNLEFMRNKNSMAAFMYRLGPVYAIRNMKRAACISRS
jgi:hypothetical protein